MIGLLYLVVFGAACLVCLWGLSSAPAKREPPPYYRWDD